MSQFQLVTDPNATNFQAIDSVVQAFNSLPGSSQFLDISTQNGSKIYVTDNPSSPLVSPGNRAYLGSLGEYRALDQTKGKNNVIIFNPNPPDNKPLLNSLIHEIGHEKWPGLGSDATQHDPLFYALLNNALKAFGITPDPNQDLQGVDISNVQLPAAAISNPLSYNRPAGHVDNDSSEVQFASTDAGQWSSSYSGSTLTETQTNDGNTLQTISYVYDANGSISQENASWQGGGSSAVYSTDAAGNAVITQTNLDSNSNPIFTDTTTIGINWSTDQLSTPENGSSTVTSTSNSDGSTTLSVQFADATEQSSFTSAEINSAGINYGGNGSFIFGSSQSDTSGLVNQFSVNGQSGLTSLSVTDPTTGATANIAFDNGSTTTLQEGRSVATDAPNEQAMTTESNGQVTDSVFGPGATVPAGAADFVDLVGDGTTATVDGTVPVALTASNQGVTLDGQGSTVTVDTGVQNESITGTGITVVNTGGMNGNVYGDNDTVNLTTAGGSSVGLWGNDDTVVSQANYLVDYGAGTDLTVDGSGNSILLTGSSSGDTLSSNSNNITLDGTNSTATIDGSHNTLTLSGTNDTVTIDQTDLASGVTEEIDTYVGGDGTAQETGTLLNLTDGTSQSQTYNPSSTVNVSYIDYSGTNETGYVTQQGQYYTDGSTGVEVYDAGGAETSAYFNLSNGTSQEDTYNPAPGVSLEYTNYSGLNDTGSVTQQGQYNTDGSSQFTFIDLNSSETSETDYYNTSGAAAAAVFDFTNGTSEVDYYNPQAGVLDQYTDYSGSDETGSITKQGQYNTDYSQQATYFNPSNGVASQTNYTSPDGTETSSETNYTNGTSREDSYSPQSGISDQFADFSSANGGGAVTQTGASYTDGTSEITTYNPSSRVTTDAADYNASGQETYEDETFITGRQEDTTYDYNGNGVYTGESVAYYNRNGVYEGYEDYNRDGDGEAGNYGAGYGVGYGSGGGGGGGYDGGGYDGGGYDGGGYDFAKGTSSLAGKGTNIGVIASFDLASGHAAAAQVAETALDQARTSVQSPESAVFEGAKWESQVPGTSPTITWSFAASPGSASDPFSGYIDGQYQKTVEKAVQAWASASGLNFVEVHDSAASDLRIGWGAFDTQKSGVLGYTSYQQTDGSMKPGTIIRLEDPSQDALSAGNNGQLMYDGTEASLYQVVLHEIGHALGLSDNGDPGSVMYASSSSSNQSLDATDIAGIRQLYGTSFSDAVAANVSVTTKSSSNWENHPASSSASSAGVGRLVQAMARFDPERSADSLTAMAAQNAVSTPTLAASNHH